MTKPEDYAQPPEIHYSENAKSYRKSTRLRKIQRDLAQTALDVILGDSRKEKNNLSDITAPLVFLDLGCGTGMSGRQVARNGHFWIGCDISRDMLNEISDDSESEEESSCSSYDTESHYQEDLNVIETEDNLSYRNSILYNEYNENENKDYTGNENVIDSKNYLTNDYEKVKIKKDLSPLAKLQLDISCDFPFKPGSFDHIISISCIQWLFHNRSLYEAKKSFLNLFNNCKSVLKLNGKAIFQWYGSSNKEQTEILINSSKKAGFFSEIISIGTGRNKKTYLLLTTSYNKNNVPQNNSKKSKMLYGIKAKIMKIKERHIRKGHDVGADSKFTGRKRCKKFK